MTITNERLAEIRDLNVDSCSADAPHNPDVWALESARKDLLAEVDRLHGQRDRLLALHEYDELIFGGFICTHCTPDDTDDPDDNVYWPCPSLLAVGVDNDEGNTIIRARRAEIARKAAQEAGA
ncbi:hypothetical protein ACIBQX_18935 [Nonomuraea sp. NPDC049714]|uniref:hypothetical protein n=1 Tax=Nonomuraea sp. NPDC049714 TaxID=3364357 RepID=UPI00378A8EB6